MSDKKKKKLDEIERTQAALRKSIEQAKELTEKSDRLLRKQRIEPKKDD